MQIEIVIVVAVVLTSMLSGVLGMAGGILLMALLVSLKSIAAAMIIHGVVQGTANGSRAWLLRRHLAWKILPPYLLGAAAAFGAFASIAFLPNVHWVMIAIGSLLDFFYLHARLDRYQVVANKALTQTIGHMLKLIYYGGVVGGVSGDGIDPLFLALSVGAAVVGTRLGTRLLDRVGDGDFRRVSRWVILGIGAYCIGDGAHGLLFAS